MTAYESQFPADGPKTVQSAMAARAMSVDLSSNDSGGRDEKATKLRADVANVIKSSLKRWFGRGPQLVRVDFSGTLVIVHCRGVLSKHEISVLSLADLNRYAEQIHSLHVDYFRRAKESIASEIGRLIGLEILGLYYEIDPALDESFFVVRTSGQRVTKGQAVAMTTSDGDAHKASTGHEEGEDSPQARKS